MQDLHPLEPEEGRGDGKAPDGPVRTGQALDVLRAEPRMPQAQTGCRGCDSCPNRVAAAIKQVTTKGWGL